MRKLTVIACAALLLTGCKGEKSSLLYVNGRIEGDEYVVSTKYGGKVEKLFKEEGDWAKRGEVLGQLESKEVKAKVDAVKAAYEGALRKVKAIKREVEAMKERLKGQEERLRELKKRVSVGIRNAKEELKKANFGLKEAEAQLLKAKALLSKVEKDYERFRKLYLKRVISKSKYEEAELKLKEARSSYQSALSLVGTFKVKIKEAENLIELSESRKREVKALEREIDALREGIKAKEEEVKVAQKEAESLKGKLKEAQAVLENLKIYSPINGVISQKLVHVGEVVAAGAPIYTMYNLNNLYFEGYIPEKEIGLVHIGQRGFVKVDSYPKRKFPVVLTYISNRAEFTPKEVQTKEERVKEVFKVKLKLLENPNYVLKPGMPADCYIELGNDSRK
ncbi:HlyD family secretion protein [Thermovibrio sp.]